MGITKRYPRRWDGFLSYWATKSHHWLQGAAGIVGNPNDNLFPFDNTWAWKARAVGTYVLSKGFEISSFSRAQSGTPGQRGSQFNSPELSRGPTTLSMGPLGQFRQPVAPLLNIKAAKLFTVHGHFTIEGNAQLFNVTNSSAYVSTNYLTGARTFGVASDVLSPRVHRLGDVFSF